MAAYNVKLIAREEVAEGTMAFHFERPMGFAYKAGQHIDVTLVNPMETDAEGNRRTFSLTSAPYELELGIATRMRDTAFKRVLGTLPIGTEVRVEGPFGSLMLHNDAGKPAVFLSGGIGITPFMSMVSHAAHEKLPHKIFLFYSNRRPEDAAFLGELQDLTKENPNYTFVGTMTEMEKSARPWNGETGYITKEMMAKYVSDLASPIYYIAGPPAMVSGMLQMLGRAGVDGDHIRTEEFAGY